MFVPPAAINAGPPVEPRPSATVLLVRGARPWTLLMMRRPGGADFAPGAYVFPGGTVRGEDSAWPDHIRAAGIRELFEEVGILLARSGRRRFAADSDCGAVRSMLESGSTFADALARSRLEPAFDRLVLLERWITPAQLSRRYDARFFLAHVPAGQSIRPQEGEVTDWQWIAPRRALSDPSITLVYATRAVLESVAGHASSSALMAAARRRREVVPVEPRLIETEAGWEVVR